MIFWFTLLFLLPLLSALPLETRADQIICGKFDTVTSGSYSLLTNLWGESSAASGSQCSTLKSIDGYSVSWSTKWAWTGGTNIKSFSNVQLNDGINQQIGTITSMPSTWHWSQEGSGTERIVSNVAYDLFTSHSPDGSNAHEVMIWLGKFNAGPISNEYDEAGHARPVAQGLDIAGHSWDLHIGSNDHNPVYSFLPAGGSISSFSGDVYEFLQYLIRAEHISSSEYLTTAQAGTEATCGSATLETLAYSLKIN